MNCSFFIILVCLFAQICGFSFIVLGDLHVDGTRLKTENLEYMVDEINEASKKYGLKFVIIVGDLTKRGTEDQFLIVKKELDRLIIPYIPACGNHDTNTQNRFLFESTFRDTFMKISGDHPVRNTTKKGEQSLIGWNFQNFQVRYGSYSFIFLDFVKISDYMSLGVRDVTASSHPETLEYLRTSLEEIHSNKKQGKIKGIYLVHHHPLNSPVLFVKPESNSFPPTEQIKYENVIREYYNKIPFRGILTGHFHVEHSSYPIEDLPRLKQWVFPTMDLSMIMKIGRIDKKTGELTFERYVRSSYHELWCFYVPFELICFSYLFFVFFEDFKTLFTKSISWAFLTFFLDLFHSFQSFVILNYIPHADAANSSSFNSFLMGFAIILLVLFVSPTEFSWKIRKYIQVKLFLRVCGVLFFYLVLITSIRSKKEFEWVKESEINIFGSRKMSYDPMFRLVTLVSLDINTKVFSWVFGMMMGKKATKERMFRIACSISIFSSLVTTYFMYTYWIMITDLTFLKPIFGGFTVIWLCSYLIPVK